MRGFSIVVVGTGGVGGYFGGRLARAGERVAFVARGAHLDALRRSGLTVRSTVEGEWSVRVEAVETVDGREPADVVLLCVKAFDTEAALERARPAVGPATAVISLQNGVEAVEKIEAALGPGHAVGGAAYVFANIEAPGVIAHRFAGRVIFGELDGRASERCRRFLEALTRAQVPAELASDIRRVLWEKYAVIGAQAGVTAVTRCPSGVIRETPETWRFYRMIVEEYVALAAAAGAKLPPEAADTIMKRAAGLGPETTSSLAHDLAQGRRLELETLHGYAVRLGERLGVPTPMVFAVYAALKPYLGGSAR
ncbi:MAG: 2-dehydropantoate 2-reductase [Candidatus Rokubacteria bacterium]|nr:2-dehydropantoate 2-reductase [Candidatus Rokubacteria bacterium]